MNQNVCNKSVLSVANLVPALKSISSKHTGIAASKTILGSDWSQSKLYHHHRFIDPPKTTLT